MSAAGQGCLGACHIDLGVIKKGLTYQSTTPECPITAAATTAITTIKVFVLSDKKKKLF